MNTKYVFLFLFFTSLTTTVAMAEEDRFIGRLVFSGSKSYFIKDDRCSHIQLDADTVKAAKEASNLVELPSGENAFIQCKEMDTCEATSRLTGISQDIPARQVREGWTHRCTYSYRAVGENFPESRALREYEVKVDRVSRDSKPCSSSHVTTAAGTYSSLLNGTGTWISAECVGAEILFRLDGNPKGIPPEGIKLKSKVEYDSEYSCSYKAISLGSTWKPEFRVNGGFANANFSLRFECKQPHWGGKKWYLHGHLNVKGATGSAEMNTGHGFWGSSSSGGNPNDDDPFGHNENDR